MSQNEEFSRPPKLTHAQTVLYEIDMLRFAKDRLQSSSFPTEGDKNIYIEAFLLHYRNLLEFFSGRNGRDTDLSIAKPGEIWGSQVPDKETLASLTKPDLHQKYDSQRDDFSISKFLHHCTSYRIVDRGWNIAFIYEEIRPVLEKFESVLPNQELSAYWRRMFRLPVSGMTMSSTFSSHRNRPLSRHR
jgi:hypothetical protein